jgi:hypothetical protein
MSNEIVRKIIIPSDNLVSGNNHEYIIRYRIVSEDKNRLSHWSPAYKIAGSTLEGVEGAIQTSSSVITVVWGDELNRPKYDVFIGFDGATPVYHGTSLVHSYSLLNKGLTSVKAVIQIEGINKILNDQLEIYDSGIVSLV